MIGEFTVSRIPRLIVKDGGLASIPGILVTEGVRTVAVVTGGRSLRASIYWERLERELRERTIGLITFSVSGEPSPSQIDGMAMAIRRDAPETGAILAIGGGSVIDAGKALAAAVTMDGGVVDYLEGVGTRNPPGTSLPVIAVPTTAGTGSEASRNAVLSSPSVDGYKKSLRHENFVPRIVVLDAELHRSCPESVTRASGLDAITQLLEAYVSTGASRTTDMVAVDGLRRAGVAFPRVLADGSDIAARRAMAYASYLGGIALANAGLGVVHGIASPLGGYTRIPHGVVCGLLVPESTERELRQPGGPGKYAVAADVLGTEVSRLVDLLREWAAPIPRLSEFGLTGDDLPVIAAKCSNKNQPTQFTVDQITAMLRAVLD